MPPVKKIYQQFAVPPNLQTHMLRVTSVADYICSHWRGLPIDKDLVKKAALLHDLGNIVKFDFDKHPEFLGDETRHVDYWKSVQNSIIKKYGTDDHSAAEKMLIEIDAPADVIEIVQGKSFGKATEIKDNPNWLLKILFYSDMRVTPHGIGTLEERLADIRERYAQYKDKQELFLACSEIEKQIQENVDIPLSSINNLKINLSEADLLSTVI
jgi:hypothetical protein